MSSTYFIFFLLLLLVILLGSVGFLFIQQGRLKKIIAEVAGRMGQVETHQNRGLQYLESKSQSLIDTLSGKTNTMTQRVSEETRKLKAILDKTETKLLEELDGRVERMRYIVDQNFEKVTAAHQTMRRIIQENENQVKRLASEINHFANDMKKMQDYIRGRNIDLEL